MKVAVLGTGGVGSVLGSRWATAGHAVAFGSRDPASDKARQLIAQGGGKVTATSPVAAIQGADVIVCALPWSASQQALAALGDLSGRVLVDCTNPLLPDFSGIELGHQISAAERIAEWAPGAKVVKSFNTASTKVMKDPKFGEHQATMFYCGDDPEAKGLVRQLITDLEFEPVDAGRLTSARYLEPLAMLYIHLAFAQGWGSNCALKILKR